MQELDLPIPQIQKPTKFKAVTLIGAIRIKFKFEFAVFLDGQFACTHHAIPVEILSRVEDYFLTLPRLEDHLVGVAADGALGAVTV